MSQVQLRVRGTIYLGDVPARGNLFIQGVLFKPPHILPPLEVRLHSPFRVTVSGDWVEEGDGDEKGRKSLQ